jgi:tetratricopeptide (TPR) repeat protein
MPNRTLPLLTALCALLAGSPLLAAGGGGGGGGGMSAPSESAPQYDPAEEYRKGIAALQAKDYKAAKLAFDRVSVVAPRDANSQYLAGTARQGLNDWKGARRNFERAAKLDPNLIRAWRELGLTHAKLGDAKKAGAVVAGLKAKVATCGTSCAQAGELAEASKAIEAALIGQPSAAVSPHQNLLFASSTKGDAFYLEAVSLINERRYEEAISSLRSAQGAFGPHPDILTYLGFTNRKMGRFVEAEEYYRAALAIAPRHRGATEYYGELMVERGDLAGARAKLAALDKICQFGCYEAEELRRWIAAGQSPHS